MIWSLESYLAHSAQDINPRALFVFVLRFLGWVAGSDLFFSDRVLLPCCSSATIFNSKSQEQMSNFYADIPSVTVESKCVERLLQMMMGQVWERRFKNTGFDGLFIFIQIRRFGRWRTLSNIRTKLSPHICKTSQSLILYSARVQRPVCLVASKSPTEYELISMVWQQVAWQWCD